jgi:hypothetical protein
VSSIFSTISNHFSRYWASSYVPQINEARMKSGEQWHVCATSFVVVAIDSSGGPNKDRHFFRPRNDTDTFEQPPAPSGTEILAMPVLVRLCIVHIVGVKRGAVCSVSPAAEERSLWALSGVLASPNDKGMGCCGRQNAVFVAAGRAILFSVILVW